MHTILCSLSLSRERGNNVERVNILIFLSQFLSFALMLNNIKAMFHAQNITNTLTKDLFVFVHVFVIDFAEKKGEILYVFVGNSYLVRIKISSFSHLKSIKIIC